MVRTCVTWDVLLVLLNPPQDLTSCRAGARPGHPISRHYAAQHKTAPRGQLYLRFSTSGSSALAAAMSASPPVASPFLRLARPRPYNALASLGSSLMALLKSATASTLSPVLK